MDKISPKILNNIIICENLAKILKIQVNLSYCKELKLDIINNLVSQLRIEFEKLEKNTLIDSFDREFGKIILSQHNIKL